MELRPLPGEVQAQARAHVAGSAVVHALRTIHVVFGANGRRFNILRLLDLHAGDRSEGNGATVAFRHAGLLTGR